jgi:putative tricarboxylic transport membrane protein
MVDWASLIEAAGAVFSLNYLFYIAAGVVLGVVAGILPGINGAIGIALVLPFTLTLPPAGALLLMLGLWGGQNYGGGVTSVLVHTPGATSGAATLFDGYPLSQRGFTGKALGIICVASATGWFVGAVMLSIVGLPLSTVALRFGPPEYFAVGVFGLSMVSSIGTGNVLKGFIATILGLLIVTVGTDPFSGGGRFTFGRYELIDGISYLVVMIGVFALAEVMVQVRKLGEKTHLRASSAELPSWAEIKSLIPTMLRSSVLGMLVGAAPGAGGSIAAFIAYNEAKRFSKHPEEFGHGSLEGVAAPEAANNASEGGALVPLLTLGVPGSGAAAVILAAMIMFGVRPGPELFTTQPVFVYTVFLGLLVGAVVLLFVGLLLTRWLALVVRIPQPLLLTIVTGTAFMAALSLTGMMFDVRLLLLCGIVGYLMRAFDFSPVPMILAMVLGFMIETSMRRSLILSDGSWSIFWERPISAVLLVMAIASFSVPLLKGLRSRSDGKKDALA